MLPIFSVFRRWHSVGSTVLNLVRKPEQKQYRVIGGNKGLEVFWLACYLWFGREEQHKKLKTSSTKATFFLPFACGKDRITFTMFRNVPWKTKAKAWFILKLANKSSMSLTAELPKGGISIPLPGFLMPGPTTSIQDNVSDNDSILEIFPDFIPVEEEKNRLGKLHWSRIEMVGGWSKLFVSKMPWLPRLIFDFWLFGCNAAAHKLVLALSAPLWTPSSWRRCECCG